jgi:predicted component of type VI protein secretion system
MPNSSSLQDENIQIFSLKNQIRNLEWFTMMGMEMKMVMMMANPAAVARESPDLNQLFDLRFQLMSMKLRTR